jgi:hypothetical protein
MIDDPTDDHNYRSGDEVEIILLENKVFNFQHKVLRNLDSISTAFSPQDRSYALN